MEVLLKWVLTGMRAGTGANIDFARWCVLFVVILIASPTALAQWSFGSDKQALEFSLGLDYRRDDLKWNIGFNTATPNILSELTWSDMDIAQLSLKSAWSIKWLQFRVAANYGEIINGDNQDSDYFGNDRTLEFSRSNNDADGDVRDYIIAFGIPLRYFDTRGKRPAILTPLLGYARHEQRLKMKNGNQTIPNVGPFPGLNSSYDTEWNGWWLGLDARFNARDKLWVDLFFASYPDVDYDAEADWNLRDDLAHPVSFVHNADGDGYRWRLGITYDLTSRLAVSGHFERAKFSAKDGVDTTFFANTSRPPENLPLHKVSWDSDVMSFRLNYHF